MLSTLPSRAPLGIAAAAVVIAVVLGAVFINRDNNQSGVGGVPAASPTPESSQSLATLLAEAPGAPCPGITDEPMCLEPGLYQVGGIDVWPAIITIDVPENWWYYANGTGSTGVLVQTDDVTNGSGWGVLFNTVSSLANDPCDRAQVAAIAGNASQLATRIANCSADIPGYNPATFVSNIGAGRPSLALLQGGNPDLFEETADTESVGAVFRPRWVPNLTFSADYWKIKVDDAINTIPINTLLTNLCYDTPGDPNSNRFCDLILRDSTGATTGGLVGGISEVILTQQNVQAIETSGVDVALQHTQDFGGAGVWQIRLDGTKVIRWDLQGVPGGPTTHYAGTLTGVNGAVPEYKVNGTLGWTFHDLTLQWQSRFQDSYAVSEVDPPSSRDPFYTGNYWEHDLRATYRWNDSLSLRAGLINLTDEHPPLIPEVGGATGAQSSTYDNRGRWFYIGANYSFGPTGR